MIAGFTRYLKYVPWLLLPLPLIILSKALFSFDGLRRRLLRNIEFFMKISKDSTFLRISLEAHVEIIILSDYCVKFQLRKIEIISLNKAKPHPHRESMDGVMNEMGFGIILSKNVAELNGGIKMLPVNRDEKLWIKALNKHLTKSHILAEDGQVSEIRFANQVINVAEEIAKQSCSRDIFLKTWGPSFVDLYTVLNASIFRLNSIYLEIAHNELENDETNELKK